MPSFNLHASNGEPFRVSAGNPGAGNNLQINVPTDQVWILDQISGLFTTSATVANRKPIVQYEDGGGVYMYATLGAPVQAASLAVNWAWIVQGQVSAALADGRAQCSLPVFVAQPGSAIILLAIAKDAGDAWTAIRYSGRMWRLR